MDGVHLTTRALRQLGERLADLGLVASDRHELAALEGEGRQLRIAAEEGRR